MSEHWSWRCWICGALGRGYDAEESVMEDARRHALEDPGCARDYIDVTKHIGEDR